MVIGAASFPALRAAFLNAPGRAMIMFEAQGRRIVFELPLPDAQERRFSKDGRGSVRSPEKRMQAWEQACRQRWRRARDRPSRFDHSLGLSGARRGPKPLPKTLVTWLAMTVPVHSARAVCVSFKRKASH